VNSANIVFDAIQMATAFKNPMTRIGRMGTSSEIRAAQKIAVGDATKVSLASKAGDYLNPFLKVTGSQLTEGVEEGINYYGTLSGKNYAKQLTGEKEEDIDWGQLTESAFWGTFGGLANSAVAGGYKKVTGDKSTKDFKDMRIAEIQGRMSFIDKSIKTQNEILNNPQINDQDKKDKISNLL